MDVPNVSCPDCGRAVPAARGSCLYCGAALPAPGDLPSPLPTAPAAPIAAPARPAAPCQAHADVPAVGRCLRCRRGLCGTCAFKIPVGWTCADCVLAAGSESGGKGRAMAILSIFLGVASIGVLGLMIVMAASSGGGGDINAMAMVMTFLSIGLGMGGMACWGVSLDQARGSTGPALVALIANLAALALLFLMSVVGAFMRG